MAKEEGEANSEERMLQEMEESGTLCSSFFQQKGAIEHKNYLRLKDREIEMIIQYKAATVIQAAWRGYLIRENMKIIHAAAAKIQALLRGRKARDIYVPKILEYVEKLHLAKQNAAATKIQALIRGYLSRKNAFDFKKYQELLRKNSEMERNIQMINEMEKLLKKELNVNQDGEEGRMRPTHESSIQSLQGKFGSETSSYSASSSHSSGTLDGLVRTSFNDLSKSLSKCRIEELLTYVTTSASDPLRNNQDGSTASIKKTSSRGANLRVKDSLDDLFPEFPEEEGLVKPDSEKVEALKTAIRLLREKIKTENHRRLSKHHYLLRTTSVPGVYSDIYSNDLTDIEKELKAVKFLNSEETKSKVVQRKIGKGDQRKAWDPNFVLSSKNDLQRMMTLNNNAAMSGKNLKRQLNLRKRGSNQRITANGHPLTAATTDTETATTRTETGTDGSGIEERAEESYSAPAQDGFGDQSVRAILNANTV